MVLNSSTQSRRVLVTGATGNIGSATLANLSSKGLEVVAGLSDLSRGAGVAPTVESRPCNYRDAIAVARALEGVDAALLLVPFEEDMVAWGRQFTDAARRAGTGFILRVSGLAASPDSPSAIGRLHGEIDEAVRRSGVPFCILRCNAFMQNFSGHYARMIRNNDTLYLPEESARLCFIDTRDIAEVAAGILAGPEAHYGKTYDLEGPEALSNADAVAIISSVIGREVEYRAISPDEARAGFRKSGLSDWKADALDSLARFIRGGHAARRSADLDRLLRRTPCEFRQFADDHSDRWVPE